MYKIVYPEDGRKAVPDEFDTAEEAKEFVGYRYRSGWIDVTAHDDICVLMSETTGVILKVVPIIEVDR